jgi:hypothetical protein
MNTRASAKSFDCNPLIFRYEKRSRRFGFLRELAQQHVTLLLGYLASRLKRV